MQGHYVNSAELYRALVEWKKERVAAQQANRPATPLPDFVAECVYKIAEGFSMKGQFARYTYREDMIGEAMRNCLLYLHNFDPDKSENAFAYVTEIIKRAFVGYLEKEESQLYVKMKVVQDAEETRSYNRQDRDQRGYANTYVSYLQENMGDVIVRFEQKKQAKKERAAARKEFASLNPVFWTTTLCSAKQLPLF